MPNHNSNNKLIAKNTAFLYIRMLLVLFVSLFTTRIVFNALGVEDYGINNVVCGFVSMFAFLNTSMSNGIQRFYNYQIGREDFTSFTNVYNTAILVQIILAIVIVVLLETLGLWYIHTKMVIPEDRFNAAIWIYQFSVLSLVFIILQIPYSAAILATEKMGFYAYVSIFDVFAKLVIAIVLPKITADKLIWYGALSLTVTIVSFSLYIIYSTQKINGLHLQWVFHKGLFKSMLSFSGWNVFGTFAYMLQGQGLNVLLNSFFGVIVNSARGISNMVMNAIQGFQSNIVISFRPQLVQSYAAEEYSRVKSLMYSLSKLSYILLFVLSVPVIIEIKYILHLWLGDSVPEFTVPFTILVLANMIVSSLNTPLSQVVHATGKMKAYQIATSITICSVVPVSWIVLKAGGDPVSVFWVSLAITIVNQVVCIVYLRKIFDFNIWDYSKEVILKCILLSVTTPIIPIIIHTIMPESFFRLICVCIVEIISTAIIAFFAVLNSHEKALVQDYVKKLFK